MTPVNIVSSAYVVTRMAPPVRLSNGWLVGAVRDTSATPDRIVFYKSQDNGKTWSQLAILQHTTVDLYEFSITSKGNRVYWAAKYATSTIYAGSFDAATFTGNGFTDGGINRVTADSGQSTLDTVSIALNPDGTKLWWAAGSKNSTYPNSNNIRAGSIPINADGTLGAPSASQVTMFNSAGIDLKNPCIIVRSNGNPFIAYEYYNTGLSKFGIGLLNFESYWFGGGTSPAFIFDAGAQSQLTPSATRTPNAKLHTVWHGKDSNDTTNDYVRYSNATTGTDWLATPKKLVKGKNASITCDKNGKLFITYEDGGYIKRIESTDEFASWTAPVTVESGSNPSSLYDQTFATNFVIPPTMYQTSSAVRYYGELNSEPTLTLTSPADNQTLSEGKTYSIAGSATDVDNGNVVTVKYKVNNWTARAINSGVSDGSTPIAFSKNLTYRNKRLWDGSTDVVGADLAENADHTLTIWAEDDQGGKSPEVTRKFRVVWNRPPTISGKNGDLGTFLQPPTVEYSAIDPEGNTFTFTEYLNGKQIRSFDGTAGENYVVQIDHDAWIRLDLDVQHEIRIRATDSAGSYSERVYTFTRTETHIEFVLNFDNPDVQAHFVLDGMPQRVLVTLERYIPEGATIESVKVCNNALDASPTWEDATNAVKTNRGYLFTNTMKTAANWAINIWVVIAKGSATERVKLNGFGGAFD